jgi:hypothetical protein
MNINLKNIFLINTRQSKLYITHFYKVLFVVVLFNTFVKHGRSQSNWNCAAVSNSGVFTRNTDCTVSENILINGVLNITGIFKPDTTLPQVIGNSPTSKLTVEKTGALVLKQLILKEMAIDMKGGDMNFINCEFQKPTFNMIGYPIQFNNIVTSECSATITKSGNSMTYKRNCCGSYCQGMAKMDQIQKAGLYDFKYSASGSSGNSKGCSIVSFEAKYEDDTRKSIARFKPSGNSFSTIVKKSTNVALLQQFQLIFSHSCWGYGTIVNAVMVYRKPHTCATAPKQCQENGYPASYICIDKPDPNEGVDCRLPCPISTAGDFQILTNCFLLNQIVVDGILNITGVPDTNGLLPKIIGSGTNRHFKVQTNGKLFFYRIFICLVVN